MQQKGCILQMELIEITIISIIITSLVAYIIYTIINRQSIIDNKIRDLEDELGKEMEQKYIRKETELIEAHTKEIVETRKIISENSAKFEQELNNVMNSSYAVIEAKDKEIQTLIGEIDDKIKKAREESVKKSKEVISGKVAEQLVPYFPNFKYNPKDMHFIGSPIDYIIFNGLDAGNLVEIVLLEVKNGKSTLNAREKQVKNCVSFKYEIYKVENKI